MCARKKIPSVFSPPRRMEWMEDETEEKCLLWVVIIISPSFFRFECMISPAQIASSLPSSGPPTAVGMERKKSLSSIREDFPLEIPFLSFREFGVGWVEISFFPLRGFTNRQYIVMEFVVEGEKRGRKQNSRENKFVSISVGKQVGRLRKSLSGKWIKPLFSHVG